MKLTALDHVAIAVADVEASARWYVEVLGFERMHSGHWDGVPTFVGVNGTGIALFPQKERAGNPGSTGVLHFAFRAPRNEFLRGQEELTRRSISFDFEDHGISHSIYFRDPDGHQVEITTYEL